MPWIDSRVSFARCSSYKREEVYDAVKNTIDLIGGIGRFVEADGDVLLKPNLLMGAEPERCVTTHPEVVAAVARIIRDHGCRVLIADSPGAGMVYSERNLKKVYARTGLSALAEEPDIRLNLDTGYRHLPNPDGSLMKGFQVITPALEADAIVVVSKAKTHMYTYMTGAAKNLFGVIPGYEKPSFHARFTDNVSFGKMIADLNLLMKPSLQVMDAIEIMEGDGPMSGTRRHCGAVIASGDPFALDCVLARIMGIEPERIGWIADVVARGVLDPGELITAGEEPDVFSIPDLIMPASYSRRSSNTFINRHILKLIQKYGKLYTPRPVPDHEKCNGCGMCMRACPVGAITMPKGKPVIGMQKCIRCYCCHEMCGQDAIELKRGFTGRVLAGILE